MFKITLSRVVRDILLINIIFFILTLFGVMNGSILYPIGSENFNPLQLITHMFMHGGLMHIIMNMLALVFLGPPIERRLGYKKFIWFYLISGVGASLFHMFVTTLMGGDQLPMVGASGAVFAIIAGFGFLFPNQKIQLWPIPIGFKAKWLSIGYVGLEVILMFTTNDNVAHADHVGGALVGISILYFITKIKKQ